MNRTTDKPEIKWIIAVLMALAAGVLLRMIPFAGFGGTGFDENLYRVYVDGLTAQGLLNYSKIVEDYIAYQKTLPHSILPPMRFLYIFAGWTWKSITGCDSLTALHHVASLFSILTLPVAFGFAYRLGGRVAGLCVLVLMAFAPTQLHMSQHALVDGFFAFWALLVIWLLWENLQRHSPALLIAYTTGLMLLVMTKENWAFVMTAIACVFVINSWIKFGVITRPLLICTATGPFLGACMLIVLAGGMENFFETYILSVSKNYTLPYAIKTGDGPWHRYLVDLLLVSPVVLLLAIGAAFQIQFRNKPGIYLITFIAGSYLIMCNLKYGMNMRYTNMWDMPLRYLAAGQLTTLSIYFGKYRTLFVAASVIIISALELQQYYRMFVEFPMYEMVTEGLLRALRILKD
jgi:hypothetical protein